MDKPNHGKRNFAILLIVIGLILLINSLDMGFYTLRQVDIQSRIDKITNNSDIRIEEELKLGNLIIYPMSDNLAMLQYRTLIFRKSRFVDLYQELPIKQFTLQTDSKFSTVIDTQTTRYFLSVGDNKQLIVEDQLDIEGQSQGYEPLLGYMLFCLLIYPFVFKKKKPSNR